MGKPRARNSIERAIREIGVPSVIALITVPIASIASGPGDAGVLLFAIALLTLLRNSLNAKYWNVEYTMGYIAAAIFAVTMIPDVFEPFVTEQWSDFAMFAAVLHILHIGIILKEKVE